MHVEQRMCQDHLGAAVRDELSEQSVCSVKTQQRSCGSNAQQNSTCLEYQSLHPFSENALLRVKSTRECLVLEASYHPDGGLVEHGDEGQHGAGAADDGQGLSGEGGVHHAAHGRRSDHLLAAKTTGGRGRELVNEKLAKNAKRKCKLLPSAQAFRSEIGLHSACYCTRAGRSCSGA